MVQTPTEKTIALLEAKLARAREALVQAQFAIDSVIMLQGVVALEPYSHSIGAAIREIDA